MKKVKTFILCANQNVVLQSLESKKYDNIGDYAFLFLGAGDVSNIEALDNVIVCRNLPNNIENEPNWLIYTGWYALYYNGLLDGLDKFRVMDYDINIIHFNNESTYAVKSSMGFDFNDHFFHGFGDVGIFIYRVEQLAQCSYTEFIKKYNLLTNQTHWFSAIDMLVDVKLFGEFMEWFKPLYELDKDRRYVSHHLERYFTIYLILNNIEYEICRDESVHEQLKGHKYYS